MIKALSENFIRALFPLFLSTFFLFMLVFVFFPRANQLDNWLNPVRKDWTVLEATIDGKDLILYGTMKKVRECSFQPPPRARDAFGNHYLVELKPMSPIPLWVAGQTPQRWGPWRVVDGANKQLEFFIIDRCHFMWDNLTVLGKFKQGIQ